MVRLFLSIIIILSQKNLIAQDYKSILEASGQKMLASKIESDRRLGLALFTQRLDSLLSNDKDFFDADLSEVRSLSALKSSDNRIRIFTWNMPLDDGTYDYHGRLMLNQGKSKIIIPLKAIENSDENTERKRLSSTQWKGAIYYDIIRKKHRKNTYYTLLGWDGHNNLSTKKIIEVLKVSKSGELTFGAPIFVEKKVLNRKIFEYSKKASMSLTYDSKKDRIVFDHLAPISSNLTGMFEFYSPDFTYDAFNWRKGKWHFEKNVDARNDDLNDGNKSKPIQKGLQKK